MVLTVIELVLEQAWFKLWTEKVKGTTEFTMVASCCCSVVVTYHGKLIKASPIVREMRRIIQKLNGTYKK